MATAQEKLNFYLPREEASELRRVAKEQRRTMTEILRHAARQIIADHTSNGPATPSEQGKGSRAATEGA